MTQYQQRIAAAEKAGFEFYVLTWNEDGVTGCILTNTNPKSPFNGECIDLFEDGTYEQYCQFKGQQPLYPLY